MERKEEVFLGEFDAKIAEPTSERRAALAAGAQLGLGDEVAPKLPEVVDEVRMFLARAAQKLEAVTSAPLMLACGDRLSSMGEYSMARDRFYTEGLALIEKLRAEPGAISGCGLQVRVCPTALSSATPPLSFVHVPTWNCLLPPGKSGIECPQQEVAQNTPREAHLVIRDTNLGVKAMLAKSTLACACASLSHP